MTKSQLNTAPTYLVGNQDGRNAPLIVSTCAGSAGDDPLNAMPQPVLRALDETIAATRCDGLISFIVDEAEEGDIERRSSFLMRQLFDHDKTILLVRGANQVAADAFLASVSKQYTVRPMKSRRLATAA